MFSVDITEFLNKGKINFRITEESMLVIFYYIFKIVHVQSKIIISKAATKMSRIMIKYTVVSVRMIKNPTRSLKLERIWELIPMLLTTMVSVRRDGESRDKFP